MPSQAADPVAVIGMACQVPGADDIDGFWDLLVAGCQQFTEVPGGRMPGYDPRWTGVETIHAAIFERPDLFDAAFFKISPRMAAWMDPQQHLLLETSWRALEDACVAPDGLKGSETGVYVATTSTDFRDQSIRAQAVDPYSALGLLTTFHGNRISYQYDLRGPSITLDTACAGGLTSVGLAVSALRSGEIDLAIAGAVNVLGYGFMHAVMLRFGALSPTGVSRSFDARADGYVRGEGVFLVVLKRLADALADNDPVHAVIRGCALTHDGRAGGLVRTDPRSQQQLIARALRQADADIADLGYLEAHAAGTLVGDATEVMTLRRMLQERPAGPAAAAAGPGGKLWVGSVKPNIGHLEGAAGAASLMKALLLLRHDVIPPTPGLSTLNPDIDMTGVPLEIADRQLPWPQGAGLRRLVGVNSFGVGGSNAHVLLDDGVRQASPKLHPASALFVPVSAADPQALAELAARLAERLTRAEASIFPGMVRTLQHGRSHLRCRRVARATGPQELREALLALADGLAHPQVMEPGGPSQECPEVNGWLSGEQESWPQRASVPREISRCAVVPYPFQRRSHWFSPERPPCVPPPFTVGRACSGGSAR